MKVKDIITITREVNGSTGYGIFLVRLENLALVSIDTDPPVPGLVGAPVKRHWTFQAVKAGNAEIQFAKFRPWLLPQEILYEDVLPIDVEPADEADAEDAAALTGAWTLVINEETRAALGLAIRETSESSLANGAIDQYALTEPVEIHWKDRRTSQEAVVLPNAKYILLGALPLEAMDLMADPVEERLKGRHGDKPLHILC